MVSLGMKVVPALPAGNTVVIKPSELTPFATEHFMSLVRDAGIPARIVFAVASTQCSVARQRGPRRRHDVGQQRAGSGDQHDFAKFVYAVKKEAPRA